MPSTNYNTGEPLDTDDLEPLYQAANDREIAAMFPKDTPRKPQPGDRVRVTYEATYCGNDYDGTPLTAVETYDKIVVQNIVPRDAEVTVLEPARPAVPEEPKCDVEEEAGCDVLPWRYTGSRYCDDRGQCLTWERLWATSQEIGSKLYPIRYERGPVIGA